MVYKGHDGHFYIALSVHTDSYTEYRDISMSQNFDIVPYSLSHINHTKCKWKYQDVEAVLRVDDVAGKVSDGLHAGEVEPAHDEVLAAGRGDDVLAGGDAPRHVAAAQDDPGAAGGQVAGRLQTDA